MLFEKIEICNFASYYKTHKIDLKTTNEKPVVVIVGGTGQGKTSIFDAINWALYGEEYEKTLRLARKRDILDYINENAIIEAQRKNESSEMAVTLYFSHEGKQYYISRSICVIPQKNKDNKLVCKISDRMTALYEISSRGNSKRLEYDSIFLDEILPSNVRDYFLFDGDRISTLSKPDSSKEVQDAIYRVVDLELIINAQKHFKNIAEDYRRQAGRKTTDNTFFNINEEYDLVSKEVDKLKREIDELQKEKKLIRSLILRIDSKLEELPKSQGLQNKRNLAEKEYEIAINKLSTLESTIKQRTFLSSISFSEDALKNLINTINMNRKKGIIPKPQNKKLINDILDEKLCICGRKFKKNDEVFIYLKNKIIEEENNFDDEILDLFYKGGALIDKMKGSIKEINEIDEEIFKTNKLIKEIDIKINQITQELEKIPVEDISKLNIQRRERTDDLLSTERKINDFSHKIDFKKKVLEDLDKKRASLAKNEKEVEKLRRRESLAKKCVDEFDRIYEDFAEASRIAVEELTKNEFKYFVRSSSEYDISLNEDYSLEVLDSQGESALQRLSMGQSQALSLAFITAISRVSEKNPPLVIDMPFGRLDPEVHEKISRRLPEIASQIILFLIPQVEWNEITKSNLISKASHIYSIEFDQKVRESKLVETIF